MDEEREFWDDFSSFYATHIEPYSSIATAAMANVLKLKQCDSILECGGGSGFGSKFIAAL